MIDGEPTEILRTNTAFRGVVVPAGTHEVTFRYSAAEFRIGFMVSGIAAAGALVWLLIGFLPWRNARVSRSRKELEAS